MALHECSVCERTREASEVQHGVCKPCRTIAEQREALRALRLTARVLLQNAEGCAVNHYGNDFQTHGEPGWLRDCRISIEKAEALLPDFRNSTN